MNSHLCKIIYNVKSGKKKIKTLSFIYHGTLNIKTLIIKEVLMHHIQDSTQKHMTS